mgnify:CR=1 FL=1
MKVKYGLTHILASEVAFNLNLNFMKNQTKNKIKLSKSHPTVSSSFGAQ